MIIRILTRAEAIAGLRRALVALTDESTSICEAAGRCGVFCGGHRRLGDDELAATYDWLVRRQRPRDRDELEALANRWQLARQEATAQALACDVQTEERETCTGWDEFDDRAIERHYLELTKQHIRIEP